MSEIDLYSDFFSVSESKFDFFNIKKNLIFLDEKKLKTEILTKKNAISKISIKKKFPNTLIFTITKSEPVALLKFSSGDFLSVNKFGFGLEVFREDTAYNLNLPILSTNSNFDPKFINQKELAIDPKFIKFVSDLKFFAENRLNSIISSVNYDFNSKGKIFEIILDEKISVKINLDSDARTIIERLAEIFEKIGKEKIISANLTLPKIFYIVCVNGKC